MEKNKTPQTKNKQTNNPSQEDLSPHLGDAPENKETGKKDKKKKKEKTLLFTPWAGAALGPDTSGASTASRPRRPLAEYANGFDSLVLASM